MLQRHERDELYPYSVKMVNEIYMELENMPDEELFRFCKGFLGWNWPVEWLGERPEGWEKMPNYRKPYMEEEEHTKDDYIRPYMDAICVRNKDIYCKVVFEKAKSYHSTFF